MEGPAGAIKTARIRYGKRLQHYSQFALFCAALLLTAAAPLSSWAQNGNRNADIAIHFTPLAGNALPLPGRKLTLTAQLANTREILPVRALVVKDGRVMKVLPAKAFLNTSDFPEYVFELQAPNSELSYQFVLTRENSAPLFSRRHRVTRECLPPKAMTVEEAEAKLQREDLLLAYAKRADEVDREAGLYVAAQELLNEVTEILKELE